MLTTTCLRLVFQSLVRSGFFAFFGTTGLRPVFGIPQTAATTTATACNQLHMVVWSVAYGTSPGLIPDRCNQSFFIQLDEIQRVSLDH